MLSSCKRFARRWSVAAALLPCLLASCSGSSSPAIGVSCGAGTTLQSGTCVIGDAGAVDSTATSDGGSADVNVSDVSDAADPWADAASDACPRPGVFPRVNCSSTCADGAFRCADATCSAFAGSSTPVVTIDVLACNGDTFGIRTPERPGRDPACAQVCGADAFAYAISFVVRQAMDRRTCPYRVTVDPPWIVYAVAGSPGGPKAICHDSHATLSQCLTVTDGTQYVIATDDPNAPARNARIDILPCP